MHIQNGQSCSRAVDNNYCNSKYIENIVCTARETVSDNGPQFRSEELKRFMETNTIRHVTSAPFHPRTNGQADRFVQLFKNAIKADNQDLTLNQNLNAFLCKYRITPHMTTNETPSMLLDGKIIRTRLDILKQNTRDVVNTKQHQMMGSKMDSTVKQYENGEPVLVRDYRNNQKWEEGLIHSRTGPVSYNVSMDNDMVWRRHTDQIRPSSPNTIPPPVIQNPTMEDNNQNVPETPVTPTKSSKAVCATPVKKKDAILKELGKTRTY